MDAFWDPDDEPALFYGPTEAPEYECENCMDGLLAKVCCEEAPEIDPDALVEAEGWRISSIF